MLLQLRFRLGPFALFNFSRNTGYLYNPLYFLRRITSSRKQRNESLIYHSFSICQALSLFFFEFFYRLAFHIAFLIDGAVFNLAHFEHLSNEIKTFFNKSLNRLLLMNIIVFSDRGLLYHRIFICQIKSCGFFQLFFSDSNSNPVRFPTNGP